MGHFRPLYSLFLSWHKIKVADSWLDLNLGILILESNRSTNCVTTTALWSYGLSKTSYKSALRAKFALNQISFGWNLSRVSPPKCPWSCFKSLQLSKLNPEFHWLCQIATSMRKFHWQFWIFLDAFAKAKKLIRKSIAQNLEQDLLTKRLVLAMVVNLLLFNPT